MADIVLYPTLERCIETTARDRYEQLAATMLRGETSAGMADELETLHAFLTRADFRRLRAESERRLVRGGRVAFRLSGAEPDFTFRMESYQD